MAGLQQDLIQPLSAVPRHPLPLVLPTLVANTARDISDIGPVLEVVPTYSRQGGLQCGRPLLVGLGEPHT
jgi:hypothetical protein